MRWMVHASFDCPMETALDLERGTPHLVLDSCRQLAGYLSKGPRSKNLPSHLQSRLPLFDDAAYLLYTCLDCFAPIRRKTT